MKKPEAKQGKSPAKIVKCGVWLKVEQRYMTIREWRKSEKIGWHIKDDGVYQIVDISKREICKVEEVEIVPFTS